MFGFGKKRRRQPPADATAPALQGTAVLALYTSEPEAGEGLRHGLFKRLGERLGTGLSDLMLGRNRIDDALPCVTSRGVDVLIADTAGCLHTKTNLLDELTKLDGTAKGGILCAIADRLKVPIRFIGVGESIEDLRPFEPDELLDALRG